ncbi:MULTISPECIES: TMEM175 family protein [unclassified Amycolatopsis]|uniref:TMEM175 family protein n=1 Tax=unclassified Amycolatopsis TaxID=2618356 RepID=UPI002106985A|nr:TMEM175 family protein [Amycolatopsis sp. DSM 110486]
MESNVERTKSPERLVFFSDAVVAIALTLLVLPLTDLVPELAAEHKEAVDVVLEHWNQLFSFVLSFVVIARMWWGHHRIFEEVRAYSGPLVYANFVWLFTIAVLPFPTEITGSFGTNRFAAMFYTGTIFASSFAQSALVLIIRRDRNVARSPDSVTDLWLGNNLLSTAALLIAFVAAAVEPVLGYYALLLLIPAPWVARWIVSRKADR